jgi:flagellar protein FliO/FliZ
MSAVESRTRGAWVVLATAFSSLASAAERPFAAPQSAEPATAPGAGGLLEVTLSLLLVLAAVFAAGWVVRRMRAFGGGASGAIIVLADVALGAKERAVLVQVGKQQLLLGVSANQVNTLHVLPENLEVTTGRRTVEGVGAQGVGVGVAGVAPPNFKAILKRSLGL